MDCPHCGIKVEKIPWGPSKSPISRPLLILVATWAKLPALEVVAGLFQVSWSTVRDFAWPLRRHQEHILTCIDLPIDNGAVEAMNNNAEAVSHRVHGFRTGKWFTTILLHGLGDLPMPTFVHRFS